MCIYIYICIYYYSAYIILYKYIDFYMCTVFIHKSTDTDKSQLQNDPEDVPTCDPVIYKLEDSTHKPNPRMPKHQPRRLNLNRC